MSNANSPLKTLGVTLLVAGCCIGAGMLGLPLITAKIGFFPSAALFILVWLFMLSSGLLLLETNLWFSERVNLLTMVRETLGRRFEMATWGLFLFLFYCILIAYCGGGAEIVGSIADSFALSTPLPSNYLFLALTAPLLLLGTHAVDLSNRFQTAGLIVSFLLLVGYGINDIEPSNLKHQNWSHSYALLPVAVISFGFHNLVPTITHYLGRNRRQLLIAIISGSMLPLICYLLWEGIILGLVPPEELAAGDGSITTILMRVAPASTINTFIKLFTFCAIGSSYLSIGTSCIDFLADGLKVEKQGKSRILLWLLVVLPPFVIAQTYPTIFLSALGMAGAYGAVVLYGLFPALMVWKGRYFQNRNEEPVLPGGKLSLVAILVASILIIAAEIANNLGTV